MEGVLKLGSISGIKIEVHWTFSLLLLWVAFLELRQGADFNRILISQALILVLFVCVVLHELGHAITAKRFKINTQKIMLLPIGGVATLEKMPEKSGQELLVALAGPAVNVVIAFVLALIVPIKSYFNFDAVVLEEVLYQPTFQNFLFYIFIANVMLVIFNLIPAFPMDGGRIFRALLSFKLGRVEATRIASGIGQGLAILFFILGLFLNPFLILIAFFIFVGAYSENRTVQQNSLLEGHVVKEATLTNITYLSPRNSIQDVIDILLSGTEKDFLVLENEKILGVITQNVIIAHAKTPTLLVGAIMDTVLEPVDATMPIIKVLGIMGKEKKTMFPVIEEGKLIGAIDRTNISEFILLLTSNR